MFNLFHIDGGSKAKDEKSERRNSLDSVEE